MINNSCDLGFDWWMNGWSKIFTDCTLLHADSIHVYYDI